jgi:uncharacterized protein (UPF0548 family)
MLASGRPSQQQLQAIFDVASSKKPSYLELGATDRSVLPAGYHHQRLRERVGDRAVFDMAVRGLREWGAHRGARMGIYPPLAHIALGATVILLIPFGPLQILAPCRIVRVVDEVDRYGFAYGTLPGHPEQGEEAFVVERGEDGTYFDLVAFSVPADRLVRLAGPLGRAMQRHASDRYVRALRDLAATAAR